MKDIAKALGAKAQGHATHTLTIYVPSHDSRGVSNIDGQRHWTEKLGELLSRLSGGVTITPVIGGWFDQTTGNVLWEKPARITTHINETNLTAALPQLREALHDMGRELRQAEVAYEFDGTFYSINKFDVKEKAA